MNSRYRQPHLPPRANQRGVALLVALILLVVITLVGLAAVGTTILQNKAASNQFDRQIAFQSAEAALRVGAATYPNDAWPNHDCKNGGVVCDANPFSNVPAAYIYPVAAGTAGATEFTKSAVAAMQPEFVIENMGMWPPPGGGLGSRTANAHGYENKNKTAPSDVPYFRVTARSCNPTDARCDNRAIVTLQAVYRQ